MQMFLLGFEGNLGT